MARHISGLYMPDPPLPTRISLNMNVVWDMVYAPLLQMEIIIWPRFMMSRGLI